MAEAANHPRAVDRASRWTLVLGVALALRVIAAFVVTWYAESKGKPCVFGDTAIYWELARAIAAGDPYVVMQWGVPHFALRTPGYPLFLAVCRLLFGPNLLAVRLVQAVLGAVAVWLVARLARSVLLASSSLSEGEGGTTSPSLWPWIPLVAAAIAAVDPYIVALSSLVLSEATFLPLMLLGLWGLAALWSPTPPPRPRLVAFGTGLAMGLAILSRPSWALFLPLILLAWVVGAGRGLRGRALKGSIVVVLATAAILAPWWVRNARVFGRFVPTALWVGASLYDGIGPQANGESDMAFVEEPDVRSLGETEQDALFFERSTSFAKAHPGRVAELAWIKLGRFWSPWPNAGTLRAPGVAPASALVTLPVLGLIALGFWDRRRDFRALVLLAGPLVYFCVLHLIFVSSIRYRIPGEVPALGLAGVGLARLFARRGVRSSSGLSSSSDKPLEREASAKNFRRRVRKVLGWGSFLVVAILVGGTVAAYFYVTDSDTLADLIRREAPRILPGCRVDVARVKIRPFFGDVMLNVVSVREPGAESPGPMVAAAYRVTIRFDPWAMFKGKFDAREVTVQKPKLRLRHRADGSWNVQGLLADPWPIRGSGPLPPITIQEGIIELSQGDGTGPLTLLRDVSITIAAPIGPPGPIRFDLTAKGDTGLFDRVHAEGTVDLATGRATLKNAELVRLSLSEAYQDRLPAPARDWLAQAGLSGGEVDVDVPSLAFDPGGTPRFHYQATAKLRRGLWKCSKLPFPISDVTAILEAKNGELILHEAHGSDGSTSLGLSGRVTLDLNDPKKSPFQAVAEAKNLELDSRLRDWIPAKDRDLWDAYFPNVVVMPSTSAGRIDVKAVIGRANPRAELDAVVDVKCLDVSMKYRHFAYPVDHIKGTIHATRAQMDLINIQTTIDGKPVVVNGTVKNPGPDAVADLTFEVESLPLDATLFTAMPQEVKPVVNSFQPSGSIKGLAKLHRDPPLNRGDDPRGRVTFDAWIDLKPGCSATWSGLKYPIMNLQGRLEVHPDLWIFPKLTGTNGQAAITISGQVAQTNRVRPKRGPDAFLVKLQILARNLPFDQQLRGALPTPWRVTWDTLNPAGASDIDATITVDPSKPLKDRDHYRIAIVPRAGTSVKLRFKPLVGAGAPPVGPIELPMDEVGGAFVFDTTESPPTSMSDVSFKFQRAPVTFTKGRVDVKDTGQFELDVDGLEVEKLGLDEDLRKYMPPVMAQFSRRLEDLKIAKIKADLDLGWSGRVGESAYCRWKKALVVLNRNKVSIGTDMALDNVWGQLDHVDGSFNGRDLEVRGKIDLASLDVFDQQVTELTADLEVNQGFARLDRIHGKVLGGVIDGHVRASLESSPDYSIKLDVKHADLQEYAKTLPGHQSFKGLVDARVDLSGLGYEPRTITGYGFAKIAQGDLGTLPIALRFVNVLKAASFSSRQTRTAFDSAEVAFRVHNGETTLKPVRLVGNAFTLDGEGTLDVRGEIDLKLKILPLRDSLRIPLISEITRGLSGQILVVRVHGPVAAPGVKPEPIPAPGEIFKNWGRKRETKQTNQAPPWKTGLESRSRGGVAGRWFTPDDDR